MKYGVLIIGFEYSSSPSSVNNNNNNNTNNNNNSWKKLPGISTDLYQAYQYTNRITKNILVFTDIEKDYKTKILQKAILDGYVDSGLLSFIEDIKDKKHYKKFISENVSQYKINNFDETVKNFIKNLDRLVFYFTGHGKNGNIVLPDNTLVSMDYIRSIISSNINNRCQVVTLFDCCESNGLGLPYSYNGYYRLNPNIQKNNFVKPYILCISSSHVTQDSSATYSGSLFTRQLFGALSDENIVLMDELPNNTIITTSHPNIKFLWPWFTKSSHSNIDLFMDNYNSIITVKLNNCQPTIDTSSSMMNYIRYHNKGRYDTIY